MTLFDTAAEKLSEADNLVNEDILDAEDRTTIQDFYNGAQTMTTDEAKNTDSRNIVNHLLGFDSLSTAARQIEAIYSTGRFMWNVELTSMPDGKEHLKAKWEACIREKWNAIIRRSRRLKPEWRGLAGEITLFGNSSLYFRDPYDWCPMLARPYVSRGAGVLVDDLSHFVIAGFLSINDLTTAKRCAEMREKMNIKSPWKLSAINTLIQMLQGNFKTPVTGRAMFPNNQTPEEANDEQAINATGSSAYTTRVPVYFFYSRCYEEDNKAWDLTILPRMSTQDREDVTKSGKDLPEVIYNGEEIAKSVRHLLHPFFVDCKMGGRQLWHKVMGLGRLNYDPDVEIEEMFNDAMTGAKENMRRLYAVKTAADWDIVKSWAAGSGPANALPPGVEVADVGRQPNFQHAMGPMQLLMQLTRRNASTITVNGINQGGGQDELEVNALERQSRNAETLAARMNDIYEHTDALGQEIFRRFLSEDILQSDPGYDEINAFQEEMRTAGVSLSHLRKMKNGCFANVIITTSRSAGDGNSVKRAMANAALMARLSLFSAEAQQIILRRVTAEETDDYSFAETIVPYEPGTDTDQMVVASQENDQCDKMGIINFVPQLKKEDLDVVHLQQHFQSMEADLARAKVRPWDQVDLSGFMAKGSHCGLHIQKLQQNKANKELAQQATQKLQKLAKMAQEFANNMQKKQEAEKEPLSAKDQANLQLQAGALELKKRAQVKLEEHRKEAMELSREKAAISHVGAVANMNLQQDAQQHSQLMDEESMLIDAGKLAVDKQKLLQGAGAGVTNGSQPSPTPIPTTEDAAT